MSEPSHTDAPLGIFDSVRALLDTALAIVQDRTELLATEVEEVLTRLTRVLLWGLVAVFCVIIGATFLGATILFVAPQEYRALSAAGLGLLFLIVAGAGYLASRKILREMPRPLDDTLRELQKDRESLRRGR